MGSSGWRLQLSQLPGASEWGLWREGGQAASQGRAPPRAWAPLCPRPGSPWLEDPEPARLPSASKGHWLSTTPVTYFQIGTHTFP